MSYIKPNALVKKVFNPIAKRFGIGGAKALKIARRKTGESQEIPVIPVELEGARYVVSTRGESDWVKNLRAAGTCELNGERLTATELPVDQRESIIARYRKAGGRSVEGYWKQLPDAADHPVFRLEAR
jgi:hypothetical protein